MTSARPDTAPQDPARRRLLALGLGAALGAACLPAAGQASAAAGTPVAVTPGLATGSVHVLRQRGLLVVVTAPGAGLSYPLRTGPAAARHPADSFLELRPGAAGIALRDRARGALSFGIGAAEAGFGLRAEHLADLAARLGPVAAGVLYA